MKTYTKVERICICFEKNNMKFPRLIIWIVALTLAFFTSRTVIRNLWRLYYTSFEKALITKGHWQIQDSDNDLYNAQLSFFQNGKGAIGTYHFNWKYRWWNNRVRLIGLDSQNKQFDGTYAVTVLNNDQIIVLKGKNQSIMGENWHTQGFVCSGWTPHWKRNQQILWF